MYSCTDHLPDTLFLLNDFNQNVWYQIYLSQKECQSNIQQQWEYVQWFTYDSMSVQNVQL